MKLFTHGSLENVLNGTVSNDSLEKIDLSCTSYGLGTAAAVHEGKLIIGESIVYDHMAYSYSPNFLWKENQSVDCSFYVTIEGSPKNEFKITEKKSVHTLYQELFKQYPNGAILHGELNFSNFEGTYLIKSPIFGEAIYKNFDEYIKIKKLSNVHGKIVAVISNDYNPRVFYKHPSEEKSDFFSHTHALFGEETFHLLTHSEIVGGQLYCVPLDK